MPASKGWELIHSFLFSLKRWVLVAVWSLVLASPVSAATFDFSAWDAMLKKYVDSKSISGIQFNAVAYQKIKLDPKFAELLAQLAAFPPERLETREEKLSFWINVYNIMAVKMVLAHYPIKSIRNVGSLLEGVKKLIPSSWSLLSQMKTRLGGLGSKVWVMPVGLVGGRQRTLNEIEHDILRKMGEPRIHVAIVCASVSCPDLSRDAYTPERLDSQLTVRMKQFLENPGKGMRADNKKGKLHLSAIFKWFAGDFESSGNVVSFIADYASPEQRKLLQSEKWKITYMDYNWDLNEL